MIRIFGPQKDSRAECPGQGIVPLIHKVSLYPFGLLPQLDIREVSPSDLDQIVEIEKRAFSVGPYSRAMLKRMFRMRRSFNYVAEDSGKIAGYVSAIPIDETTGDVESIAVDPAYQGRGIGGMLLDHIEAEMKKRGLKRSILEVRDMNFESIGFYRKHGYVEIEHMVTYYHEYFRGSKGAFRMEKALQ